MDLLLNVPLNFQNIRGAVSYILQTISSVHWLHVIVILGIPTNGMHGSWTGEQFFQNNLFKY